MDAIFGPYLDERGYPGCRQADGSWDGGDTAADFGTILALNPINAQPVIVGLPIPWDATHEVPLRHWDTSKWYGQSDRFSRDQLTAMICGFCNCGPTRGFEAAAFFKAHRRKWFLTAWNTKGNGQMIMSEKFPDVCGPEIWALWIRFYKPWWRHIVLWFLDIQTLIGAIQWRWFTPETMQLSRNHMLVCYTAKLNSPTITSWLAYKINDWPKLIDLWRKSNAATGEIPTAEMFAARILR